MEAASRPKFMASLKTECLLSDNPSMGLLGGFSMCEYQCNASRMFLAPGAKTPHLPFGLVTVTLPPELRQDCLTPLTAPASSLSTSRLSASIHNATGGPRRRGRDD